MAEYDDHPAYPVGLRLNGRRVVVVGGGQVAQRRLPALVAAGADVTLVSPSATASVEAMADAGEIRWERRRYQDGDLTDTWYALVASSDAAANDAASAEAERTRTWCVRSDDAEAATAWTPATGRSEGITIAVLTTTSHGRDPRHSAAVRDAIVEGLRDGTLAGAALDVFEQEPLPPESPLWELENVIVSPHDTARVPAEVARQAELFCDNLRRYLAGEELRNRVDLELLY